MGLCQVPIWQPWGRATPPSPNPADSSRLLPSLWSGLSPVCVLWPLPLASCTTFSLPFQTLERLLQRSSQGQTLCLIQVDVAEGALRRGKGGGREQRVPQQPH